MSEIFWGLLGIGLFAIFFSFSLFLQQRRTIKNGVRTNAVVIGHERRSGRTAGEGPSFSTVVRYNVDGRTYEAMSSVGHSSRQHKVGDSVEIVYRKENARKIVIADEEGSSYVMTIIGLLIGLGLLIASFLYEFNLL